ncbi:ABC transporter permease [Aureibacillus halotolerans]|uniref:Peptide/nickel transport system permease protein n=1 Tax=Aureibacillus halotolerans TaxID=1508390 RepID=A0A4V3D4V2_9BACI|nr:ABC transporter permease [Aureibacillus halotolerans]TDQ37677.1 peptide/nickel transport system permease protein [Aureibacillus halotolerans]
MRFLKRIVIQVVPTMLILTFVVFALVYLAGDPVSLMLPENATQEDRAILEKELGLDQHFLIQYVQYMGDLARGDFGTSYQYHQEALPLVVERLTATLSLAGMALGVGILMSLPLGVIAALKRNTFVDYFISGLSVIGKAMPNFWIGIMLILFFAVTLGVLPVSGAESPAHFVLPAFTLGVALSAELTRLVRASVLEVIDQEFVQTARSKGQKEWIVILRHVFMNSLIPVVTMIGLQFPQLIGGTIIVETVFSWPGIGRLLLQSIEAKDMAVIQAIVFVIAIITILVNLLTDVIYRLLDPRISYESKS